LIIRTIFSYLTLTLFVLGGGDFFNNSENDEAIA